MGYIGFRGLGLGFLRIFSGMKDGEKHYMTPVST